jgi:hypothetical protein
MKGTPRSQKILRDAGHRRSEIGIVRAALDDRLLLDEDLVFPVQIETRLDCDRTADPEDPFSHVRTHKVAYVASGIRVQFGTLMRLDWRPQ